MLALTGTRLPVLLLGMLAVTIVGTVPPPVAEGLWRIAPGEIANLLARWDTSFYYAIATTGYAWDPTTFSHQNIVFFPAYPVLMRLGGAILGHSPMIAGLVVSLVSFTIGIAVLYRLAALELGESYAWRVVLLLATFPYALFFSTVYTESLFLCLSVSVFYAIRRGYLWRAAVCGVAAGLTRPNGFWLVAPLFCLAFIDHHDVWRDRPRRRLATLLAVCAPLVGVAIYSWYLHAQFGDALAWVHGQRAWGMPLLGQLPAPDPVRLPTQPRLQFVEIVNYVGNVVAFGCAAWSIEIVWRRLGLAYAAWIAICIFPPVAAHLFLSLGRFTAVLFPVFFGLALRVPERRVPHIAAAFAAGQALLAIWFFLWQSVV
ncbi:MAG: hypothetical protein LBQ09_08770 [Acidobacteriaceae bacterium]|jgi:hypothetical protein|nr:hypothetical protein [Acidobacteriaceae bacterium]